MTRIYKLHRHRSAASALGLTFYRDLAKVYMVYSIKFVFRNIFCYNILLYLNLYHK